MTKNTPLAPALVVVFVLTGDLAFTMASHSSLSQEMEFQSFEGFELFGHIIEMLDTDEFGCGLRCLRNEKCRSYNSFSDGNHGDAKCQISDHTKMSSPQNWQHSPGSTYYEILLGWSSTYPGHSCKHIRDSGNSKGDGEYWIDPENNGKPLKVFCDMTTDGGGWLLVVNIVLESSSPPEYVINSSYHAISSYHNNNMGITTSAMNELRSHLAFTQMRFHCSKQQTRTFHLATVVNSTGEAVVQFFSGQTDELPLACNSFQRMEDDNSQLATQCHNWGYEYGSPYVGKWGTQDFLGEDRMYLFTAFVPSLCHWKIESPWLCDDRFDTTTLLPGNFWKIFVR